MQLRGTRLLLVILGVSNSNLQRVPVQGQDLYRRATSSEGLLCIRKYWDAHCSAFSKLPAAALLNSSSCPRGLAPAVFLELLGQLTDLQQWQIWDLWSTLDVRACGLIGCAEFTLLVVLLCAGAGQQHLQAVHAFAGSISKTFTGVHLGSSYHVGLYQCCQLMGLPASALYTALQQQQQLLLNNCLHGISSSSSRGATGQHIAQPCSPSSKACVACASTRSDTVRSHRSSNTLKNPALTPAASTAGAADIGCCCSQDVGCLANVAQQWACGAVAHRQYCATRSSTEHHGASAWQSTDAVASLTPEAVELVLFQVVQEHAQLQQSSIGDACILPNNDSCCRMC